MLFRTTCSPGERITDLVILQCRGVGRKQTYKNILRYSVRREGVYKQEHLIHTALPVMKMLQIVFEMLHENFSKLVWHTVSVTDTPVILEAS